MKIQLLSDQPEDAVWVAWGKSQLVKLKKQLTVSFQRNYAPIEGVIVTISHIAGQDLRDTVRVYRRGLQYIYVLPVEFYDFGRQVSVVVNGVALTIRVMLSDNTELASMNYSTTPSGVLNYPIIVRWNGSNFVQLYNRVRESDTGDEFVRLAGRLYFEVPDDASFTYDGGFFVDNTVYTISEADIGSGNPFAHGWVFESGDTSPSDVPVYKNHVARNVSNVGIPPTVGDVERAYELLQYYVDETIPRWRAHTKRSSDRVLTQLQEGTFPPEFDRFIKYAHPRSTHLTAYPLKVYATHEIISRADVPGGPTYGTGVYRRTVEVSYTYTDENGDEQEASTTIVGTCVVTNITYLDLSGTINVYEFRATFDNWPLVSFDGLDFLPLYNEPAHPRTELSGFSRNNIAILVAGVGLNFESAASPEAHRAPPELYRDGTQDALFQVVNGSTRHLIDSAGSTTTVMFGVTDTGLGSQPLTPAWDWDFIPDLALSTPQFLKDYRSRTRPTYAPDEAPTTELLGTSPANGEVLDLIMISVLHSEYGDLGIFRFSEDLHDESRLKMRLDFAVSYRYDASDGSFSKVGTRKLYDHSQTPSVEGPVDIEYVSFSAPCMVISHSATWDDLRTKYKEQKTDPGYTDLQKLVLAALSPTPPTDE